MAHGQGLTKGLVQPPHEYDADDREKNEKDGQTQGDIKEHFLHAAASAEDRRIGTERPAEARPFALEQDKNHQSYRNEDFDDV